MAFRIIPAMLLVDGEKDEAGFVLKDGVVSGIPSSMASTYQCLIR